MVHSHPACSHAQFRPPALTEFPFSATASPSIEGFAMRVIDHHVPVVGLAGGGFLVPERYEG